MLPDLIELDKRKKDLEDLLSRKSDYFGKMFLPTAVKHRVLGEILHSMPERRGDAEAYAGIVSAFDNLDPDFAYYGTQTSRAAIDPYTGRMVIKRPNALMRYIKNPYGALAIAAASAASSVGNMEYLMELKEHPRKGCGDGNELADRFSGALKECNKNLVGIYYMIGGNIVKLSLTLMEKYASVTVHNADRLGQFGEQITAAWDRFLTAYEDFSCVAEKAENLGELGVPSNFFADRLLYMNYTINGILNGMNSYQAPVSRLLDISRISFKDDF